MYQACRRPGIPPRTQRQMFMRESAEQMPRLTQTAIGGKIKAIRPSKRSDEDILNEKLS